MLDGNTGGADECQTKISVSFGIRGDLLVPEKVSAALGVRASFAFSKTEEYHSIAGRRRRPWGVWQLRSDLFVDSDDVADHVRFILEQLEPNKERVRSYVVDDSYDVEVRVWCESCAETVGYSVLSNDFADLATLCNVFNFSFVGRQVVT